VSLVVNYDDELLKQYTINKKISNGSFGTVFNVTNKQTNIKSALKIELLQAKIKPTLKK
jgi:serine/threonine protein kinase